MRESLHGRALGSVLRLAFIFAVFSASAIFPQQLAASQSQPPASASTVRQTTHLVLVDVVVNDKQGKHATNLTAADFTVLDRGRLQNIAVFSNEHAGEALAKKNLPPPPPLPPDVFTNRPEYLKVEGPPTILLLDGLNTAVADQQFSHDAMLQYLDRKSVV